MHTLYTNQYSLALVFVAYLACSVRAATPDMRGVEALVPVKSSVHSPFRVVVVCIHTCIQYHVERKRERERDEDKKGGLYNKVHFLHINYH